MADCLQFICCCFEFQPTVNRVTTNRPSKKRKTLSAKQTRLQTKHARSDFLQISDQERREKKVIAYCCPICTNYYNRILACVQCVNCICLKCFELYDKKTMQSKSKLRCPFCKSLTSLFKDYQLPPHSYFDTTNNGFINKEQKRQVDEEIAGQSSTKVHVNSHSINNS